MQPRSDGHAAPEAGEAKRLSVFKAGSLHSASSAL